MYTHMICEKSKSKGNPGDALSDLGMSEEHPARAACVEASEYVSPVTSLGVCGKREGDSPH